MIEELPPSFTVNLGKNGPLVTVHCGAAPAKLAAKIAAARDALDELEECLVDIECLVHAETERGGADAPAPDRNATYASDELAGLAGAVTLLATETADLGRRRDEFADWMARCRRPVRSLRFAPRARFAVEPLIDPAEFERRLNERRAKLAQVRVRIVQALRHRAEIPNRQQEAPEA